jgi:hypothetical protein
LFVRIVWFGSTIAPVNGSKPKGTRIDRYLFLRLIKLGVAIAVIVFGLGSSKL